MEIPKIPEWIQKALDKISNNEIVKPTDIIYSEDKVITEITDINIQKLYTLLKNLECSVQKKNVQLQSFLCWIKTKTKERCSQELNELNQKRKAVRDVLWNQIKTILDVSMLNSIDMSKLRIKAEWSVVLIGEDDLSAIC